MDGGPRQHPLDNREHDSRSRPLSASVRKHATALQSGACRVKESLSPHSPWPPPDPGKSEPSVPAGGLLPRPKSRDPSSAGDVASRRRRLFLVRSSECRVLSLTTRNDSAGGG